MKLLLNIARIGFILLGPFFVVGVLLVLGIASFVWLSEPERLAVRTETVVTPTETNVLTEVIFPQPSQVALTDSDVSIISPPPESYLNGMATNVAIWVNEKAFRSSGPATREILRSAWRLWLLGAGTAIGLLLLRRFGKS